jgi:hypothetical protein
LVRLLATDFVLLDEANANRLDGTPADQRRGITELVDDNFKTSPEVDGGFNRGLEN